MRMVSVMLAITFLGTASDRTVITRDGKIHEGTVTREGTEVVIVTSKGPVRVPAVTVVADFVSLSEARRQCESRYDQAKKLFEEASAKSEHDAMRRRLLMATLDICAETRDLLEILDKRAPVADREPLQKVKMLLVQFMRLVRDAKGATAFADGGSESSVEKVPLEGLGLTIEGPPDGTPSTEITERLGSGQASAIQDLSSDNPAARIAAARRLLSPPAPHALAALSKAMQVEKDKDALQMIAAALSNLDLGPRLKTEFGWALADEDHARRYAMLALVRRLPSGFACDFLGDCLRTRPPAESRIRAAYTSAFRKLRPRSVEELRETLVKSKEREVQLEAVRQLGMMRDRAALPSLKLALGGSRDLMTAAFNAIEKTGGVAIPLVMEMLGDGSDEVRRLARILAQRITREEIDGVSELQKWYAQHRRHIEDDEKTFWKEQEEKDFPVHHEEFRIFDRKLPGSKD
jgi:hypothetical protein